MAGPKRKLCRHYDEFLTLFVFKSYVGVSSPLKLLYLYLFRVFSYWKALAYLLWLSGFCFEIGLFLNIQERKGLDLFFFFYSLGQVLSLP